MVEVSRKSSRSQLLRALLPITLALLLLAGIATARAVKVDASGAGAADDEDELEDIEDDDEDADFDAPVGGGGEPLAGQGGGGGGGDGGPQPDWIDQNGVKTMTLKAGDCRKTAEFGDVVYITHVGAKPGVDEEGNQRMEQFDGSGDKPFKVTLGEGRIIKGMEKGMIGQCLGEQRNVLIPPHLGFEDPTVRFKNKPVPEGTTILYQITVTKIVKPGSAYMAYDDIWGFIGTYYQVAIFVAVVAFTIYKCGPKRRSKKKKRG